MEAVAKDAHVIDANSSEAEAVSALLDARRSELAEVEQRLARTKEAAAQADAAHADWLNKTAEERARGNTEIDALHANLQASNAKVKEAEAKYSNILAGIAALHERLKVG